jgi:sortase A
MDLPANHVLYRVTAMQIIDSRRKTGVVREGTDSMLALVTCYPFDAIAPGGPLRYIVLGERVGHIANSFALGYHSAHGV